MIVDRTGLEPVSHRPQSRPGLRIRRQYSALTTTSLVSGIRNSFLSVYAVPVLLAARILVEPVRIGLTAPGLQSQVASLVHAAPDMLLEPWRIELHSPSLRRTDAALVHEAP